LFRSVTDCGAGGFSSPLGGMGGPLGGGGDLGKAPLKNEGVSYTQIWISQAHERMVLAAPPPHWPPFRAPCEKEMVEATDLGAFVDSGRLTLRYEGQVVGDLSMAFLHEGRPRVVRQARFEPPEPAEVALPTQGSELTEDLVGLLTDWNVASK